MNKRLIDTLWFHTATDTTTLDMHKSNLQTNDVSMLNQFTKYLWTTVHLGL